MERKQYLLTCITAWDIFWVKSTFNGENHVSISTFGSESTPMKIHTLLYLRAVHKREKFKGNCSLWKKGSHPSRLQGDAEGTRPLLLSSPGDEMKKSQTAPPSHIHEDILAPPPPSSSKAAVTGGGSPSSSRSQPQAVRLPACLEGHQVMAEVRPAEPPSATSSEPAPRAEHRERVALPQGTA